MTVTLYNTFEGGTTATTITHGNSGGASGIAFDFVTVGTGGSAQFSNTHAAHGNLGGSVSTTTANSTDFGWTTSYAAASTAPSTNWFRCYMYFASNPSNATRFYTVSNTANVGQSRFVITTAGKLQVLNNAGSQITLSAGTVPLNQWFRVEGMTVFSATVGQTEVKLFKTADAVSPDETNTSGATAATLAGTVNSWNFGPGSAAVNQGPYWLDDVAISDIGYIGPSLLQGTAPSTVTVTWSAAGATTKPVTASKAVTVSLSAADSLTKPVSAAEVVTAARAASFTVTKPIGAAEPVTVTRSASAAGSKPLQATRVTTAARAAVGTTIKPVNTSVLATINEFASMDVLVPAAAARTTTAALDASITVTYIFNAGYTGKAAVTRTSGDASAGEFTGGASVPGFSGRAVS